MGTAPSGRPMGPSASNRSPLTTAATAARNATPYAALELEQPLRVGSLYTGDSACTAILCIHKATTRWFRATVAGARLLAAQVVGAAPLRPFDSRTSA